MRNYLFLAGLTVAALTTSCSEDFDLLGNKHEVTLGATVTAESTRAAFSYDETTKKASFFWNTGDAIGVNSTGNKKQFSEFGLKTGAGEASATFKGNVYGEVTNDCYAVYPYNDDHALSDDGTTLTYVFPTEYKYTAVASKYFPEFGAKDCNSFNPALWAKVSDTGIAFKHLGGVFLVMVGKMPCTEGRLEFSAKENVAGKFTAKLGDSTPACSNTDESATETSKKVTINFSGATKDADGVFYIPVPVGTYTNLRVKIFENGNEKAVSNVAAGTFTLNRRNLYRLTLNGAELSAQETTTVSTADEAKAALEKNNNVAVAAITADGENTTTATITIPGVATTSTEEDDETATTATVTKTVAVEQISGNVKIELKDEAATSSSSTGGGSTEETSTKKSVEAVTLSIPHIEVTDANKKKLPEVEVTMPKSTVTLAGNAGKANFGTVTAETAENTLVVSSYVTIQKLVVKKGNVRIESGAKVEEIAFADGNSKCTIYYESESSLPTTIPSGFTKVKASFIDTESDFEAAMTNGGESFMLAKNLTLTRDYTTSKTTVIDLNGKTLTANVELYSKNGGNLTFKNGNITQNGQALNVDSNGALTLDNVKYTGTGWSSIYVVKQSQNTAVTVKNKSTVTITEGYYAVTTNATVNPVASNCTITLEDSEFSSGHSTYGGTALLVNIDAKVTLKNCKFTGYCQAALLRGGTYEISGCTFTQEATIPHDDGDRWMTTWGSGNECPYAALTIGNYLNTAYQYPTNVTFKDTKSSAVVSGKNASSFPAMHVCANAAEGKGVTITGLSNITKSGGKTEIEYGTANITVDDQKDPASYISQESDFTTAFSTGGIYVLKNDVTLNSKHTTTSGKTIAINLNGKTLTTPEITAINDGNLTLINGTVVQNNGDALIADSNGTLNVDRITYKGQANSYCCLFVRQNAQKATLTVNNSTINGGYYAVTSNATENPIAKDCQITLTDSKFYADESGTLLNIPAKVTMKNCEFKGNHQGGFLRCGTYTIENCTFTLNAELAATHGENNWMKTWEDGNKAAFAALTIGNYLAAAYQYATNVKFTGNNYAKVTGTYASSFPAMHVCANDKDGIGVTITGLSTITKTGGKTQSVEYGTTNIKVDDKAVEANIKKAE